MPTRKSGKEIARKLIFTGDNKLFGKWHNSSSSRFSAVQYNTVQIHRHTLYRMRLDWYTDQRRPGSSAFTSSGSFTHCTIRGKMRCLSGKTLIATDQMDMCFAGRRWVTRALFAAIRLITYNTDRFLSCNFSFFIKKQQIRVILVSRSHMSSCATATGGGQYPSIYVCQLGCCSATGQRAKRYGQRVPTHETRYLCPPTRRLCLVFRFRA